MTAPAGVGDDDHLGLSAYYDQEVVGRPAVSPSGDRVAFTMTEYDADEEESLTSLFVAPSDGSNDPHRLTRASDASDQAWSPDGSKLAFLATRDADPELRAATTADEDDEMDTDADDEDESDASDEDESDASDGDESDASKVDESGDDEDDEAAFGADEQQVFVFDLELGGDARQVTTREHGVREFDWGPESERVVVSALDPTDDQAEYLEEREDEGPIEIERLQHKANGFGWTNEAKTYLFVVDVESRESERLDEAYAAGARSAMTGDSMDPTWGSGDRIAFLSYQRENADDTWAWDLHTIASDGSDHRVLTEDGDQASGVAWHPDGEHLAYFVGDPTNVYETADLLVGADDPNADVQALSADLERPEFWPEWVGEDSLLLAVGDGGQTVLQRVDVTTGDRERVFPGDDDELSGAMPYFAVDVDDDGYTAAFVATAADESEVAVLDLDATAGNSPATADGDAVTRLTATNRSITDAVAVDCERVTVESDAGVDVDGLAFYGDDFDFDAHDYPVIVDIHGGPTTYDQPWFQFPYHHWVSRGYVVLNVNYRGSTSFGHAFAEAISGDWGPREARDVEAAVEHLIDRGWVADDRVFVTGFSQGGINTAFVLAYTDVATAGAAEHGIYDFYSSYGTDDCHVWWDDEFGEPWDDPESYYELSSITKVEDVADPLMFTAGEDDWRCPPSQAEQMYVSVKKQGVDSKLVVYPNVPHARGPPETHTHRIETITDWFREHDHAIDDE